MCTMSTFFGNRREEGVRLVWLIMGRCVMHTFSVVSDSLEPMGCSPPGSSVHGIFQSRILEWVAISFSRGSSRPRVSRDWICISCTAGRFFTTESPGSPHSPFHNCNYSWSKLLPSVSLSFVQNEEGLSSQLTLSPLVIGRHWGFVLVPSWVL